MPWKSFPPRPERLGCDSPPGQPPIRDVRDNRTTATRQSLRHSRGPGTRAASKPCMSTKEMSGSPPHQSEQVMRDVPPPRKTGLLGGPRLGRLFGVEITADWSLLIIFALITYNLGAGVFPAWHPDWGPAVIWGTALGAAVLFFVSVVLHELSHAVVGRAYNIPIRRITLFLFGGLAHMEDEPKSPKAELLMAIVGPICSAVIGIVATLVGSTLSGAAFAGVATDDPEAVVAAFQNVGPFATLLLWLGPINLLLAVFNIIPGFPLDGGRVLRSILWASTGDLTKATRWASGVGRALAWTMMGFGLFYVFGGALASGIWLILIGWFLSMAATASYQQVLVRQALEDVPVDRLMRRQMTRIGPEMDLDTLVTQHLLTSDQRCFPVESGDALVGLVCFEDVKKVPQGQWASTPVRDVMTPLAQLSTVLPGSGAQEALQELTSRGINQVPVVQGRQLVGMVQRSDLLKWLDLHGREGKAA